MVSSTGVGDAMRPLNAAVKIHGLPRSIHLPSTRKSDG
jgi:hypothetical protein